MKATNFIKNFYYIERTKCAERVIDRAN